MLLGKEREREPTKTKQTKGTNPEREVAVQKWMKGGNVRERESEQCGRR